ncbi:MAG: hypothetical protein ACYCY9_10045 [Thiobacillus sp.]
MSSSTAAAWPSPGRFALALILGLALTLTIAGLWGAMLIEALLPTTRIMLGWIDDRFGILLLGVEHNWQDTVVHYRMNFVEDFFLGGRIIQARPEGWLNVVTPVGDLLQPLVIAPALAVALPGRLAIRLMRFVLAVLLALGALFIDLPLALHAIAWDMITYNLGVHDFSPYLAWLQFTQSGGRLAIGVLMGLATWKLRARQPA